MRVRADSVVSAKLCTCLNSNVQLHWTASWIPSHDFQGTFIGYPPNLLVNFYHQFTNRLSTRQVRLRLLHAFRAERVLLVDDLPQSSTLYKVPKFVRVIQRFARSVYVVPHPETDRKREPSKSSRYARTLVSKASSSSG